MKDLVIRVEGKVLSNNIEEFEKEGIEILDNMNTSLVTDADFAQAVNDIKLCKEIEIRLGNAQQDIIHQSAEVSAIITTLSQMFAKFRDTRLTQEKLVKEEKLTRKNEIINAAVKEIQGSVDSSEVGFSFGLNKDAIIDATKRKSSIEKMQQAVNEVVADELHRLSEMQDNYVMVMEEISIAEKEYPGLFPDKKMLTIESFATVSATIESRINKFKLELIEKKKRKEKQERTPEKEPEIVAEEKTSPDPKYAPDMSFTISLSITGTEEKAIEISRRINDEIQDDAITQIFLTNDA